MVSGSAALPVIDFGNSQGSEAQRPAGPIEPGLVILDKRPLGTALQTAHGSDRHAHQVVAAAG